MTATVSSPSTSTNEEQRVVLYGISWGTYESLIADNPDQPFPRVTYDRGTMELLVNASTEHEDTNRAISLLVDLVAAERGIDVRNVGSMLFKRADLGRGFEPDTCFYIQNEPHVRGAKQIDPVLHPPPDLVIEIDVSRRSLNKLPVYAAFGVPEVWRVREGAVLVYTLRLDGSVRYDEGSPSRVLPPLDGETLTRFLADGLAMGRAAWVRSVRTWAQSAAV